MGLVNTEIIDGIAILRLNDPKTMNALSIEMSCALYDALTDAAENESVRVIVIGGEGKGFCGGGNLSAMYERVKANVLKGEPAPNTAKLADIARSIREIKKPVITAIHGAAAGAGASIALASDFTVAAEDAKFVIAFVNVGLVPDTGGMYWLVSLLGYKRATELAMLGTPFTAEEALDMGLVTKVVPADSLWDETMKLAKKLKNRPQEAVCLIKDMVNEIAMKGQQSASALESRYMAFCSSTDNYKEGVSAFMEKRRPEFNKNIKKYK